jgi:hypothetical protein
MDEYQDLLKRLSPRQRDAWEQAGYPGIRDRDPEKVRSFVMIDHEERPSAAVIPEPGF